MHVLEAPHAAGISDSGTTIGLDDPVRSEPLRRDQCVREAVLRCFSESHSRSFVDVFAAKEWEMLLRWLDVSGLALYFLDRMTEIGQRSSLPGFVASRLQRCLDENRQRTLGLLEESANLQHEFRLADLSYAVMKGISFHPVVVPRPELRHQFDLDFLIASSNATAARQILERHGYTLFAVSGTCWEFKKGQTPHVAAKDLYRDLPYRGVELHLDSDTAVRPTRLGRAVFREIHGAMMPVLSPVDLLLGQMVHASKDIASPFFRASHLLEVYRHVLARRGDDDFWQELRVSVAEDQRACLLIGIAIYLATSIWGDFAPSALTSWTMEKLPPAIRLWLDLYGRTAAVQLPPGSKRYLWLLHEMDIAVGKPVGSSRSFSFLRMPRAVIQAAPGETLSTRAARYRVQVRFLVSRVRFHFIEGLRFVIESRRWRRLRVTCCEQPIA